MAQSQDMAGQDSRVNRLFRWLLRPRPVWRRPSRSLPLAALLMAAALAVRLAMAPISAGLQYVTFFPAVTLVALLGGLRAGLFATGLGMVIATGLLTPPYGGPLWAVLQASAWANLVFLVDGIVVSVVMEALYRYRLRLHAQLARAEEAEARLAALNDTLNQQLAERQKTEELLRVAAIAFETNEAIMITDAAANILRVNRAFERFSGYGADEVIGRNPRLLASGRHDREFYAGMWRSLLETGHWSGEVWDRHKNGHVYPKQMTITAIRNDRGETTQYVSIFTDISERKRAEDEIRNLAFYDALTGLPNRRLLRDRLDSVLSLSARDGQHGALVFLDMDRFKQLNDTLGHHHGDHLLVEVARRIKASVRDTDTVARLGGDEFVVLFTQLGVSATEASLKVAAVAESIRDALASPYSLSGHLHQCSASIGVCLFGGAADTSADELLKRADVAMYQAKDSGRNRIRFFDPGLQRSAQARVALEGELRTALAERQFQLHLQLQLDRAHQPVGAEALLRWAHPRRGWLRPEHFLRAAEDGPLILDIGQWVLDAACRQLARWQDDARTRDLVLCVNVGPYQLHHGRFVDEVGAALRRHAVPDGRLQLELTEGATSGDLDELAAGMRLLREQAGVSWALDDFGTGPTALATLRALPLDRVKIDESLVHALGQDAGAAQAVSAIIDMARHFRLQVVAEGVETEAQRRFLEGHGCDVYQGRLFLPPLTAEAFAAALGP